MKSRKARAAPTPARVAAKGAPKTAASGKRGPRGRGRARAAPARARASGKVTATSAPVAPRDEARLREIERQQRALEKEKRELIPKVAAMNPPTFAIPKGGIKRFRGAKYSTWFKAAASFGNARDWDSYAQMQNLLDEEAEEFNAPASFYSQQILGRVKWDGIVGREEIIATLNERAGLDEDFRRLYPKWEYVYRIVESIGGVPVRFFEHKAKQPRSTRERRIGYDAA